jgi:hypothetical protein
MEVERYDPERHYPLFQQWYAPHVGVVMSPDFLPKVGFVVPDIAMGFLYQTDSKVCHIEGLVANPLVSRDLRTSAVDAVVLAIIKEARALGFRALHGTTSLRAVVDRAQRLGFYVDDEKYSSVTFML